MLACVVALILGREAGRGLAGFSPSRRDSLGAHCRKVTAADCRASPPSCAQTSVCEVEVSNPLRLQGCEGTDECDEEKSCWGFGGGFTVPEAKHSVKTVKPSPHIPGKFACVPRRAGFDPGCFRLCTL